MFSPSPRHNQGDPSLEPHQVQVQEWAAAHTRACEKIAGERFATRSLAAATAIAGLSSVIWHVYVDDDDYYGTAFAMWSEISVASLVGTVYKAFGLSRANRALADLGPPSSVGGRPLRPLPGVGGARADLLFDAATRRLAVVATWRP